MALTHSQNSARDRVVIHLASLGCAKNLVDSERLLARLAAGGAVVGAPPEEADVIIVNTCGFIDSAKQESIDTILELAEFKQSGRCERLIVVGCLAQRYTETLRAQIPEADAVIGLGDEDAIVAACGLNRAAGRKAGRLLLTPAHMAYLRIADGCDNRCAYCAIPIIRGPFRSRPEREVLHEARQLAARGVREIAIIGQDTTMYGVDRGRPDALPELLEDLAGIKEVRWLRLLYTHPAHFSDRLIDAYAAIPRLCPYVDLPLQHLNDTILRRMGRKVTQKRILSLIEKLRARVPGVAIRTSFIVGFPGETRAQFNEMMRLICQIRFDHLGAFTYSREEHTRAARMPKQVSAATKARRHQEIMLAQQVIVAENNRALKGAKIEVVIDGKAPEGRGLWSARSRFQAPDVDSVTLVKSPGLRSGQFLTTVVTGSRGYDLLARPASQRARR